MASINSEADKTSIANSFNGSENQKNSDPVPKHGFNILASTTEQLTIEHSTEKNLLDTTNKNNATAQNSASLKNATHISNGPIEGENLQTGTGALNICQFSVRDVHRHSRNSKNGNSVYRATNTVAPYISPTAMCDSPYSVAYQQPIYAMSSASIFPLSKQRNPLCKIQMFQFLEVAIKRILFHLAKAAIQHKHFFRILPIFLTLIPLLALWFIREEITFQTPPFDSFFLSAPSSAGFVESLQLSATVAALSATGTNYFNGSNPVFEASRRSSPYEFSIILSTRNRFDSVLANKSLNAYKNLYDQIRQISVTHSLVRLGWDDMCREDCGHREIITALQKHQLLLKYPEAVVLKTIENGKNASSKLNINRIFLANVLGGVEMDLDGLVSRASSLLLNIKLKDSLKTQTLFAFQDKLLEIMTNFSKAIENEDLKLNFWSFQNYINEVSDSFTDIYIKLIFACAIFIVFVFGAIGFNSCNLYKCQPFVALQIVLIISFSILIAYTIHIVSVNGKMNLIVFPTAFILAAISILMFANTQQCFLRYSMAALHPTEKLAFIYSWDIPCFVCCALVTSISCASSAWYTENSYLRQSFLMMSTGIIVTLVFGIFYLTVFWYNAEKRKASGLKWFELCRKGDETFNNKYVSDYDEIICERLHKKLTDLKPSFTRLVGRLASNYNIRTISVVLFTVYLIFASFGLFSSDCKIQLRKEYFIRRNADAKTSEWKSVAAYLQNFETAFEKYEDYLELVFELPIDYYNKQTKEKIFNLLRWALDNNYASKAVSWLTDFERFQKETIYDVNPDTIVPVISYVFLKNELYRKYSMDIVFDRFQTQILKSRMYLELSAEGLNSSENLIKELEKRAKSANLPLTFNAPYAFLLRHNRQAFSIALSAFAFLVSLLTVLSIILFTYPIVALCVPLSCVFVSIGVCGLANYFLIPLNIVTLAIILIGNLLTASVTIYFCYTFNNSGSLVNSNIKRIEYAFQCTLWPTFMACISIVIFYVPLLLNNTPILLHIWKMLCAISAIILLNYLFILPSLVVILTKYILSFSSSVNNFCDTKGCCVAEQPSESIYFVPSRNGSNAIMPANFHGQRSIASYYASEFSNYVVDNSLMLPPAYDYEQQMIMSAVSPPSLPPPPLPQSQTPTQHSIDKLPNGENGSQALAAHRSQSFHQQSPKRPCAIHNPDRHHGNEATDSNADSLDSRIVNVSSRQPNNLNGNNANTTISVPSSCHQTPRRNRLEFVNSSPSSQREPAQCNLQDNKKLCYTRSKLQQTNASRLAPSLNEQIYEEPESPMIVHLRRGRSGSRCGNIVCEEKTNRDDNLLGAQDDRREGIALRNIRRGITEDGFPTSNRSPASNTESKMQSNWRQYQVDCNVSKTNVPKKLLEGSKSSIVVPSQPSSSSNSNRQKYRF